MTLRALEYFVAVVERGGFSRAAEQMFVSQPTISRAIADLEEEFGVALFDRKEKDIALTPAGQELLVQSEKLLQGRDELYFRMKTVAQHQAMSLRVCYHHFDPSIAFVLLQSLKSLGQKHLDINISISESAPSVDALIQKNSGCDILFTCTLEASRLKNVAYTVFRKDPLVALLAEGHPLASRESLRLSDLREYKVVLPTKTGLSYGNQLVADMCLSQGIPPEQLDTNRTLWEIIPMLISGDLVAVTAESLFVVHGLLLSPALVKVPIVDAEVGFDMVAAWNRENPNPAIPLLIHEVLHWAAIEPELPFGLKNDIEHWPGTADG